VATTAYSLRCFLCFPRNSGGHNKKSPMFHQKSPVFCILMALQLTSEERRLQPHIEKSPMFYKKSLTFREKRRLFHQKSPVFCILIALQVTSEERRLQQHILDNASCVSPRIFCVGYNGSEILREKPCILPKEPCLVRQESYVLRKEPYIPRKESYYSTKRPCILHIDGTETHLRRVATPTAHFLQRFSCSPTRPLRGTTEARQETQSVAPFRH